MSNVEYLEESCSKERSSSIKDGYDNMYWRMLVVLDSLTCEKILLHLKKAIMLDLTSNIAFKEVFLTKEVFQAVDGQEPPEPCKDNVQATA
uniref:Uncharacterized protein n=1 Tax=Aegilops tauschii TaxID=37682 RepID=M8BW91_AEGTA